MRDHASEEQDGQQLRKIYDICLLLTSVHARTHARRDTERDGKRQRNRGRLRSEESFQVQNRILDGLLGIPLSNDPGSKSGALTNLDPELSLSSSCSWLKSSPKNQAPPLPTAVSESHPTIA